MNTTDRPYPLGPLLLLLPIFLFRLSLSFFSDMFSLCCWASSFSELWAGIKCATEKTTEKKNRGKKSENWKKTINLLQLIGQLCVRLCSLRVYFPSHSHSQREQTEYKKNKNDYLLDTFSRPSVLYTFLLAFVRFNSRIIFILFYNIYSIHYYDYIFTDVDDERSTYLLLTRAAESTTANTNWKYKNKKIIWNII